MKYFILLSFTLLLAACTIDIWSQSHNTYVPCLLLADDAGTEFVVNSQQAFEDEIGPYRHDTGRCFNRSLPTYDFNHYTLVGKVVEVEGCSATFKTKTEWDDEKQLVYYYVYPNPQGDCDLTVIMPTWRLVGKIPPDYDVVFVTKES